MNTHTTKGTEHNAGVSRETAALIDKAEDLIMKWNGAINLTGARSKSELHQDHGLDAIGLGHYIQKHAPAGTETIFDLGSGNGMPSLILSLMIPNITIHMIESDTRKCAFLREAVYQLKINAKVIHKRAEQCQIPENSVITACAFKDCKTIIKLTTKMTATPNLFLLKGAKVQEEIAEASQEYSFAHKIHPIECGGTVVHIHDIRSK